MVKKKKTLYKAHRQSPAIHKYFLYLQIQTRPSSIVVKYDDMNTITREKYTNLFLDIIFNPDSVNTPDDLYDKIEEYEKFPKKKNEELGHLLTPPDLVFKAAKDCARKLKRQNNDLQSLQDIETVGDIKDWCLDSRKIWLSAAGTTKVETATGTGQEKKPKESMEVPWDDDNLDYMYSSKAIVKFTGSKMPVPKLSKLLKPYNKEKIHYMRKQGIGCKVHIGEFIEYAKREYPPNDVTTELIDEFVADKEAREQTERRKKTSK